jgi:hypothetical protein
MVGIDLIEMLCIHLCIFKQSYNPYPYIYAFAKSSYAMKGMHLLEKYLQQLSIVLMDQLA